MNNFLDSEQRYKLLYYLIHFLIRAYVNYILKERGHDSEGSGLEVIDKVIHLDSFQVKVEYGMEKLLNVHWAIIQDSPKKNVYQVVVLHQCYI